MLGEDMEWHFLDYKEMLTNEELEKLQSSAEERKDRDINFCYDVFLRVFDK